MKTKIRLDTVTDAAKFVSICSRFDDCVNIHIKDNKGMCVNAKSLMGAIYSLEFTEIWCESDIDIYTAIKDFAVE